MTYAYRCEKCCAITEKEMGINDNHPKTVKCKECGEKAFRFFGSYVHIPNHFKAVGGFNDDSPTSLDHLKRRFTHSHPSGRDSKIYY